jgi:hypothetical protein
MVLKQTPEIPVGCQIVLQKAMTELQNNGHEALC